MQRIPGLEMAIYAQGRAADQEYCALHGTTGASLIELGTFLKYEKQLKNLQLQESRLERRYAKEMAELRSLQKERKQQEQPKPATASHNGFVFSNMQNQSNAFSTAPAITPSEDGFQPARCLSPAPSSPSLL